MSPALDLELDFCLLPSGKAEEPTGTRVTGVGDTAQLVGCLPTMHQAVGWIPLLGGRGRQIRRSSSQNKTKPIKSPSLCRKAKPAPPTSEDLGSFSSL